MKAVNWLEKKHRVYLVLAFALIGGAAQIFGQTPNPEAKTTRVLAETEDSVLVQVSTSRALVRRGDDIRLNYLVTNKNKRTVYLVTEKSSKIFVDENFVVQLLQPARLPDDQRPFVYDLIKIRPGRSVRGSLTIKADAFLGRYQYDFEILEIQVGFSYLFDKSRLADCKETTFVRPCLEDLYINSKSLMIGNLVVQLDR